MKFYIYTLGCKVNSYESNIMRDNLLNSGYIEGSSDDADIYIINTCTVTNTSDNKSLKVIRRVLREHPSSIIVAVGCMTQVNSSLLKDLGISIVLGNKDKSKIVDYIEEYKKNKKRIDNIDDIMNTDFEDMCLNNFNKARAFVKIEDGCENYCSYCIIPYARGKVRSKKPDKVISEIKTLIDQGHKEIVLTGIHTGHYNYKDCNFYELLKRIIVIKGLERLRISSIEITEISDDIISLFKECQVLVDHLHIPLQSGSNTILKLMNRKYDKEYFIKRINDIRSVRPDVSITTDVIVGFPMETDKLFKETIDTIKKIKFSKIHVFPFSLRRGTKAEEIPNHVDNTTKKKRVKELINLSKNLEIEYYNRFIDQIKLFIPEKCSDGYLMGHTDNYLPIKAKGCIKYLNQLTKIKIKNIDYPYVIGEIIEK